MNKQEQERGARKEGWKGMMKKKEWRREGQKAKMRRGKGSRGERLKAEGDREKK